MGWRQREARPDHALGIVMARHRARLTTGDHTPLPGVRASRNGIVRSRRNRTARGLPITEPQQEVLDVIEAGCLVSASELGRLLDRPAASVTSSLYALQDRGLVERVPFRGWRLSSGLSDQ